MLLTRVVLDRMIFDGMIILGRRCKRDEGGRRRLAVRQCSPEHGDGVAMIRAGRRGGEGRTIYGRTIFWSVVWQVEALLRWRSNNFPNTGKVSREDVWLLGSF